MILDLIQNIALLVALAIGLQMLARRFKGRSIVYRLVAGLLFGVVGIVGMMTPMRFAEGVFYDGRSIVLSLAGLFGGPVSAGAAAVMCGIYRVHLGGIGVMPGLATIFEAAVLGVALHYLRRRDERWIGPTRLLAFGLLVHVLMLACQLWLPQDMGWKVIRQFGLSVLVFYPIGFLMIAQVFLEGERWRKAEDALRESEERYRRLFEDHAAVKLIIDPQTARIVDANASAEKFYGWSRNELRQMKIHQINTLTPAQVRREMDKAIRQDRICFEFRHRRADSSVRDVEVFSSRISLKDGDFLHSIIHDISERKQAEARVEHLNRL
jgi:PAS domain S-box-containing protein